MSSIRFVALFLTLVSTAHADLIPPTVQRLRERAAADPSAYDRADTYCQGRKPGASCEMPGSVFDGGGTGACRRDQNAQANTLDLECHPTTDYRIDRRVPDSDFHYDGRLCEVAKHNPQIALNLKSSRLSCDPQPSVADRFCAGKNEGDVCQAVLILDSGAAEFSGRCKASVESTQIYYQGRHYGYRTVIGCQSANPVPHTLEPAEPKGLLQKLMQ